MKAKELIIGQAFKFPGKRKYRIVAGISTLNGTIICQEHKGKLLIIDKECHQWLLDPECEVIPGFQSGFILDCTDKYKEPVIVPYQEDDVPEPILTKLNLDKGQITLSDALQLIDSDDCKQFDIHYRYQGQGNIRGNIHYCDHLDDNPDATVEKWIKEADNHGSFWLSVWYDNINEKWKMFQIVDDKTFEPL